MLGIRQVGFMMSGIDLKADRRRLISLLDLDIVLGFAAEQDGLCSCKEINLFGLGSGRAFGAGISGLVLLSVGK